jgi:hypothetical protein
MDTERKEKSRTRWPRWTESGYVDRSEAFAHLRRLGGSVSRFVQFTARADTSALRKKLERSAIRYWLERDDDHKGQIPIEVAEKLDEYISGLKGQTAAGGLGAEPLKDARALLVALHDNGLKNHYPELVRIEFRRDNRSPQTEGDAIAIGYHINVRTDWLYQGRNRRIGIRELAVRVIAAAGHVGELRKPAQSAKIPGVGLKIDGVRSELRADFAVEDPQGHLDLNGLDDAILLAIYDRGRAGDGLTIELFVDLDHGFACVRASNDPPAPPRTPRKFREKVIEHLAKRGVLGDLALAPHVTLCSQALKIAREPEESP